MDRLVRLNRAEFERQLHRKGRTAREVCRLARLDESQLSHALAGRRRLQLGTLRRLAAVLDGLPDMPDYVAGLVGPDDERSAAGSTSAALLEANGGTSTDAPPEA